MHAQFVLHVLLGRSDLEVETSRTAVRCALAWLNEHARNVDAGFVLPALLGRSDLEPEASRIAVSRALTWLNEHERAVAAGFVLPSLLGRSDLEPEASRAPVRYALAWLDEHVRTIDAQFVFHMLLGRSDLEVEASRTAVRCALAWLNEHARIVEARFVLSSLLDRSDLEPAALRTAVGHALTWLNEHVDAIEAQFVLSSLLGRNDLAPKESRNVVGLALSWVSVPGHSETINSQFVYKSLLRRGDLPEKEALELIRAMLPRLEKGLPEDDATFVLRSLLQRRSSDMESDRVSGPPLRSNGSNDIPINTRSISSSTPSCAVRGCRIRNGSAWPNLRKDGCDRRPMRTTWWTHTLSLLSRPGTWGFDELARLVRDAFDFVCRTKPTDGKLSERIRAGANRLPPNNPVRLSVEADPTLTRGFEAVVQRLNVLAKTTEKPSGAEIQDICNAVDERARRLPASASYAVSGLTVMAMRSNRHGRERIRQTLKNIPYTRLTQAQRTAFWFSFEKVVEDGAFGLFLQEAITLLEDCGFGPDD